MKRSGHGFLRAPHRLISALVVLFFCQATFSPWASTNGVLPYSVRIWQTDDGLPQNSVHAITQTGDGYLWVGTREGLARFDGVRFTLVDESAAPELKQGWITALCAGSDGSLWIACDGSGVTRLKNGTYSRFTETNGLPSNQTRCLLEGKDGSIWIGSEGGLTQYKDGKFKSFTVKSGLGDDSVRAICEDHSGNIRIATRRGLSSLDQQGVISTLNIAPGMIGNALKGVCVDRQGRIWVGSNEGLNCLEGDKRTFYSVNEGLPDRITTVLYENRGGDLWVGTYSGLAQLVNGAIITRPIGGAVSGDRIHAIFEDREENLWVGTWDGLYRLSPARFTTYTTEQGLTCNNVMSVCEDRNGTIWLGTWGGGLNELQGDRIRSYGSTNGLTHDLVLSLHEARDGSLWVGMEFDGGLNRFKDGGRNLFSKQSGFTNAAIRVIHEDRQGTLWVGTSRGLKTLKKGKLAVHTTDNGLAGNTVMAICEDQQSNVWVGTDGGLSCWSGGKFTNFTTREGLSHNGVDAIYEDGEGTLWIGTKGGGVNRFKAGKFTAYTTKEGLFSDEVYEIVEDDFGFFWMSCRRGIFRVSRQNLDDLDEGIVKVLTCTSFGKADGLASVQCNGVAKPAGWKSKDGRLWFPTIRGVVAVEPKIKTNELPPPVLIEEVIADKRQLAGGRVRKWESENSHLPTFSPAHLLIPPGRGELEIQYTALSFSAPEKNRFKYMLEGMDPGWVDAGTRRAAYYNNISPGHYRFRVIACNNDGVWNELGATLALVLLPHYWQTWWFKLAIAAAVGLLLTAFYRTRVARLREIESLRIEIAANLHDDVGARLTKVAMVTESVDRQTLENDRIKPQIRNISRTTREVIQAMDEIVWTINPKNDTLDHLANYIFQYAQEYFQNTGVRCRLDLPAQLPDCTVSTEDRHNLFMAVKEALNNVLKHAGATEVRIGLTMRGAKLTVTIADNGCGFLPDQPSHLGNGLDNMKQRLERIGGRLVLESKPGSGTIIRMEVDEK